MNQTYKPEGYNSVSSYLVVDDAQRMIELLKVIFDARELRKFPRGDGKIAHVEVLIDDTVIMMCDSTENAKASKSMLHVYVRDVYKTFDLAMANGCTATEKPVSREGDPDTRGGFLDYSGNYWAIGTQNK